MTAAAQRTRSLRPKFGSNMLQCGNMGIDFADPADLPDIVDIYNASIPGRLATADMVPVTVESRQGWFAEFDRQRRPIWIEKDDGGMAGWLSLRSFYGRPAYHATVEVAVYCR